MKHSSRNALFLAVLMMLLLSLAVQVLAHNFDGTQSGWAASDLDAAFDLGLTYPDITNQFTKEITREEFCTIVVKLYEKYTGETAQAGADPFEDTDNPEILKAFNLGIVSGTSATTFTPQNKITRQEICVMITRFFNKALPDVTVDYSKNLDFADSSDIASWALNSVKFAFTKGIMRGTSETTISPLSNTSREQAIILLKRAYETALLDKASASIDTPPGETTDPADTTDPGDPTDTENPGDGDPDAEVNADDDAAKFIRPPISGKVDRGIFVPIKPVESDKPELTSEMIAAIGSMADRLGGITFTPQFPEPVSGSGSAVGNSDLASRVHGTNYLGRGYDVITGKYADADSLKEWQILDNDKLFSDKQIYQLKGSSSRSRYMEGNDIYTYSQGMAGSVSTSGGFLFFKGSVSAKFSGSQMSETNRSFATLMYDSPQYRLFINPDADYSKYVSEAFKRDVAAVLSVNPTMSFAQFFERYGTHVLRSINMGGRIEYNATAGSSYFSKASSFQGDVEASFNAFLVSANAEGSYAQDKASSTFTQFAETKIEAYPSYGWVQLEPAHFNEWYQRMLQEPGISDFGQNALMDIATLAQKAGLVNSANFTRLQNEYFKYAEGHKSIDTFDSNKMVDGIADMILYYHAGAEEDAPEVYLDNNKVEWQKMGRVSSQDGFMISGFQNYFLYVRYGPSYQPIIDIIVSNTTKGISNMTIFDARYGGADRHYFYMEPVNAVNGPAQPTTHTNINHFVNANHIGIYKVRSRFVFADYPAVQGVRIKSWSKQDSRFNYAPASSAMASNYYQTVDHKGNIQDLTSGNTPIMPQLPAETRRYLEYTYAK